MHPKDIVRHLHSTLRQSDPKRNEPFQQSLPRPTTCVVQSEELYKLDLLLQKEFPTIYELIGGIEGLLMCADKGDARLSSIIRSRESFYDNLVGSAYLYLEAAAVTEANFGNEYVTEELPKEFMRWGFQDVLMCITDTYRDILTDELETVLQKQNNEVTVACIMQTPIKGVYYIQIDPY